MRIYSEDKLRKRVSILRMSGAMNQLNDNGLIELTKCELLLENHLNQKRNKWEKEMDEFLDGLGKKNGYTEY